METLSLGLLSVSHYKHLFRHEKAFKHAFNARLMPPDRTSTVVRLERPIARTRLTVSRSCQSWQDSVNKVIVKPCRQASQRLQRPHLVYAFMVLRGGVLRKCLDAPEVPAHIQILSNRQQRVVE